MTALRLPWAFVVRDVRVETSYKAGLVLRVLGGLMSVLLFYFVAEVVRRLTGATVAGYGDYFSFVVVGLGLLAYMGQAVGDLASKMRQSQGSGELEILVLSPARHAGLVVSASLPGYLFGLVTLAVFTLTAALLGADFGDANVPAAVAGLVVATASFVGLGLFAAAFVLVTKRGNPVAWAIRAASLLLAGVLYPVDVLPQPLRALSEAIPLTHALELERRALLLGDGFGELWQQFAVLAGLTAVLLPLGLGACRLALGMARTDGSLTA